MNFIIDQQISAVAHNKLSIKIKTTTEVESLTILYGDPFDYHKIDETTYLWNQHQQTMILYQQTKYNHYFETTIDVNTYRTKYYFQINNESLYYGEKGFFTSNQDMDLYSTFYFPYLHSQEVFKPIDWVKDQVWCQIFVDRFNNNQNNWPDIPLTPTSFYGGTLNGITEKLDHLKELGFSALYLTPIFSSPSNHKYDTIDYYQIDEHFGTREDLKELVNQCHKRGMKIILDAVFNHSGYHFEPFQDVIKNKNNSDYFDWFHVHSFDPLHYETFSNVKRMPKLNTTNPKTKQYLIDILLHYLREFKIDGWRFDVANELDHQFIRDINHQIKAEFPNAYLLAEIWHNPNDWIDYDQFDANMDYQMVHHFIQTLNDELSIAGLIQILSDLNFRTPPLQKQTQFHLADSHDTPRLINQLKFKTNKALLALNFLATLKGSICLFYGTHYLLEGEMDPYCRVPYPKQPTDKQLHLQKQIAQILNNRKKYNSIFQSESPQYKEKDNQLIVDYPSLTIIFDFETIQMTLIEKKLHQ